MDESDGLSPEEAAFLALDHNPALRALRARRRIAHAEIVAAGILPNPRLDGELSAPAGGGDAQMLGYGVGLAWNVTPLLARAARRRSAGEQAISVDLEVAWQEWQVAQAARLHTIRHLYLEREIAVAMTAAADWRQRVAAYEGARAAQAATALEAAQAQRSRAQWELRRQDLARRRVAEDAALAVALGVDADQLPALQASGPQRTQAPATTELLAGLPTRRLDLIALQHARRSRDAALRAAALARFPPIEIGLLARREVDGVQAVGFTLGLGLPIFDRHQAERARQQAHRGQVEAEYAARLAQARTQTIRYAQELSLLREQVGAARTAATAANHLAELAGAAARAGNLNSVVAADTRDQAYRARLRALEIERAWKETQVALSIAAGVYLRDAGGQGSRD